MRRYQRGVTFLGWIFILVPVALVVYAGIQLSTVYIEYMKIARTLEQVSQELKGDQPDVMTIRNAIERRFDIEDVNVIQARDAEHVKVTKQASGYTVEAVYQATRPYISNVSLQVNFDKVVQIE